MAQDPFPMKFMDGTPVDQEYAGMLKTLLAEAIVAEEYFTLDELEDFARTVTSKVTFRKYYEIRSNQTYGDA